MTTLIWAGDADWICNWYGGYDVANAISYSGQSAFKAKTLAPYKVNGKEGGTFKTQGNLSFLRVYEAGHEVPYYRKCTEEPKEIQLWLLTNAEPELALQAFIQTMKKGPVAST